MCKKEWKDFVEYCSGEDSEWVCYMTEGLIEQWEDEKESFPLEYNYKKAS